MADLADVQSMIDHFLVRELLGEVDGYQASTYMYRLRGGKLTFGPVWDFDQALGLTQHNVNPEGWLLLGRPLNWHLRSLLTEPAVAELLQQRWAHMRQALPLLQNFVTTAAQGMEQSQQANFARWPIMGEMVFTNVVAQDSYEAEVQYLQDWLAQRAQWMDANIQELPALSTLLPLP